MLKKLSIRLSHKHKPIVSKTTLEEQIAKPKLLRGCAWCKHAEIADSWHIQSNRCRLRNLTLGKDISKEDGCERFEERSD
jgi:hypothetical protein